MTPMAEAFESQPLGRERAEPAGTDETHLLALGPHVPDAHLHGQRDRPHAHQDDLRVVGHVLLEPRVLGRAPHDFSKISIGFFDHGGGPLHRLVVLPPDLDDPVLVGLGRHRDRVVRVQQQIAPVVTRQELVHQGPARHLADRLRVREERAVRRDRDGQKDTPVLGDPVGEQRGVQHLLGGVHPDQQPAQVTDDQGVIVLDPEGARIVEGPVAHHAHHRHAERGRDGEALHRVHPADAGRAAEHPRPDGGGVLHDLELAVLAFRDDVLGLQMAVGDLLGDRLHDRVVGPDRVRGHHVEVGQGQGLGTGLGRPGSGPRHRPRCRRSASPCDRRLLLRAWSPPPWSGLLPTSSPRRSRRECPR